MSARNHLSGGQEIRLVGLGKVGVSSGRGKLNKQLQQGCLVPTAESGRDQETGIKLPSKEREKASPKLV